MNTFQSLLALLSSSSVVSGCQCPLTSAHSFALALVLSVLSSFFWPPHCSVSLSQTGWAGYFFFSFFSSSLAFLSGWVDVRTLVPEGGRGENRICSLRMQRGKKVEERDGWIKGFSTGLHLM